ncbi:hypothetical protein E2C01_045855 [Portunus trituberculatus]|uniref:Uncharacterized protein n=1 Tax=Portunus trituberculatus TaxID=210409 RepID=A0A5B7G349_PORTR|nr:hypothetical protein [Portunus trituberculatus]
MGSYRRPAGASLNVNHYSVIHQLGHRLPCFPHLLQPYLQSISQPRCTHPPAHHPAIIPHTSITALKIPQTGGDGSRVSSRVVTASLVGSGRRKSAVGREARQVWRLCQGSLTPTRSGQTPFICNTPETRPSLPLTYSAMPSFHPKKIHSFLCNGRRLAFDVEENILDGQKSLAKKAFVWPWVRTVTLASRQTSGDKGSRRNPVGCIGLRWTLAVDGEGWAACQASL